MTRAPSLTRRQRSTLRLAIRVVFLLALVILSATCPALHAQGLSESGLQETRAALAAAQRGNWPRAYASAAAVGDPLPLKIVRWLDYSRSGAPGRFADIAEFIDKNPDWPRQKALRRHAEEVLAGESDAGAADWFRRHPPVSAVGKAREAEIMLSSGDLEGGTAALRATWIGAAWARPVWPSPLSLRMPSFCWLASPRSCVPIPGSLTTSCVGEPGRTWSMRQRGSCCPSPEIQCALRRGGASDRPSLGGCCPPATPSWLTVSPSSTVRSKALPIPRPSFCWATSPCAT